MQAVVNEISVFRGKYAFLSNYAPSEIRVNGLVFPTVEHAFAAFKTTDLELRAAIAKLATPGDARAVGRSRRPLLGRKLVLRPDWETIKDQIMTRLVRAKFTQNEDLCTLLLATGDAILREGTAQDVTGHLDTVWGIDLRTGKGENRLGKILMELRTQLRAQVQSN